MPKCLAALFAALLLSVLPGCSQDSPNQTIGVIGPFTGEGATYGASMKRGLDLAIQSSNIRAIYEDDKLNAKDGVAAIQKLTSLDRVSLVFGSAASSVTAAIVPIANQKHVVLFSSISTADTLSEAGPYFYRNVPANALQGRKAADYVVNTLKQPKIAIFHKRDEYGTNLASSFRSEATQHGAVIVYDSGYLPAETDFRSQLTRIKESGAAAVFIPGNYQDTGIILKQARELGLDATFVGGDGSYSPALIAYAGSAAEGFVCTLMAIDESTDMFARFTDLFKHTYGQAPDVYDAFAYEAGTILRQTLLRAVDRQYKDYLDATTFESFSGPLIFHRGQVDRDFGLVLVKDGAFVKL